MSAWPTRRRRCLPRRPGSPAPRIPALAATWLALVLGAWLAAWLSGVDPSRLSAQLLLDFATGPWGVMVLLAAFLVRAVVLFPSTVLTLFAGWALGAWLGGLVAWIGVLASASLAYALARWVRRGRHEPEAIAIDGRLARWAQQLRERAFEAILFARLASLPGDAVNVMAGASRTPFVPFLAATALGGSPGLLAVVLAGASVEGAFRLDAASFRPGLLLASLALAGLSIFIARWVRRRAGDLRRNA